MTGTALARTGEMDVLAPLSRRASQIEDDVSSKDTSGAEMYLSSVGGRYGRIGSRSREIDL